MKKQFEIIDGETLMDKRLPPTKFCVDTLIPHGLSILAGAPKLGKSWLALDLCVKVAKGEDLWNLRTNQGAALYLCLEDSLNRVQERLNNITDEPSDNILFVTKAEKLYSGLEEQIRSVKKDRPDLTLIVIDTFQIIRPVEDESSYANDYNHIQALKRIADELDLSIVLIHHLRKMGDSDPLNKISGSTGISGAADAVFVLDVSRRRSDAATLVCTGRDIPYRELELKFGREVHTWSLVADSLDAPEMLLPEEIQNVISFVKTEKEFKGTNSEFTDAVCSFFQFTISAKALKQLMNKYRYQMEEQSVYFKSSRSSGQRLIDIRYLPKEGDESDGSDE